MSLRFDSYVRSPRQAHPRRNRTQVDRHVGLCGHLFVRSCGHAGPGLRGGHSPAHGQRFAAHGPRVQLHAHRHRRPLLAHAREVRLLSHGMGRQRPPHRAPRAELLRRVVRPVGAVRRRFPAAVPRRPAEGPQGGPGVATELHRTVRGTHRSGRESVRGPLPPAWSLRGLVAALRDHRRAVTTRITARFPPQPLPGRGLHAGGTDTVGRRLQDGRRAGRARGPRASRCVPHTHVPQVRRFG